ncbi:right-handed parallel beta-helix repeat-containing protein [Pontiellaceae bacterium B12227]|nr:right-handed parallel beta-helix repeat-containing protein [Pontiellaceae bacterium B12227]
MKIFYASMCFGLGMIVASPGLAERIQVVNEDFDALAFGDTTGINNAISDGTYDAGLRLHNHLVGEAVTPHANFTTASGQALQLTTGTNPTGGWGQLSADNSPRTVTLVEGEDIVLSFDMYVQAVPGGSNGLGLELILTGGEDLERTFSELSGASVGDVIQVTWTQTVSAAMATATAISPRIGFEGIKENFENPGTDLDIAQIDNLVLSVPGELPAYYIDADGGSDLNSGTSPSAAWATLAKAGTVTFSAGDRLLLQAGDTFNGKLVLDDDNGTAGNPIVIGAYGFGNKPVIDASGYEAGIHIVSCDYLTIQDLEITGDGGAHIDGSDGTDRYGVYISNTSGNDADGITISNVYFHTIYPDLASEHEGHNPTTYTGYGIRASGQGGNHSEYLTVQDCRFENLGMTCLNLSRQHHVSILDNLMENIGGPCMVPNRCDDLLVRGNVIDGSGQYTDPRMHGRGSGIWPINCDGVLIEKNAFMHARGRYDSCGVHLDIGNKDAVVQYNLSMDNEGGFVEILGVNSNCTYRYNISINDGNRRSGVNENGLSQGGGHTILFSSHNFSGQERHGPYWNYIYNNTIFVKEEQHASFSIEQGTLGILVANNIFYIEGELEDENPYWRGAYTNLLPGTAIWTNNLYQRGGIYPENWIFEQGDPVYGNPQLPNTGGVTAEDYIPMPGSMVEGRSVDIPLIPGDPVGLEVGFAVTEDFFGNPILGQPDIGAVEIGGGVSAEIGSAFYGLPQISAGYTVALSALPGPAGAEYYFEELSGHYGGNDSGWQSDTNYTDSGLLPNTPYRYAVTMRDAADQEAAPSVVKLISPASSSPAPDPMLLDEDFTLDPNAENTVSPFPVHTWYLDDAQEWSRENQTQSVSRESGRLQLGFGYEEAVLQYYSDQTWDLSGTYTFTGDWLIETLFENHLGFIAGFAEHDPSTGALLQRIKEVVVGDLVSPVTNETGSFTLTLSPAELQAAGVSATSRVGVFFHKDDDGVLYAGGSPRSDIYHIDNLSLTLVSDLIDTDGDSIPDTTETALGLNPNDPDDGAGDLDSDGLSNAGEFLAGTGINDSNDVFGVSAGAITGSPAVIVPEENVLSNRLYILEHRASLRSSDPWIAVDAASGTTESGDDYSFLWSTGETQSFFRVRTEWE